MKQRMVSLALALAMALVACNDSTGPTDASRLTLSFVVPGTGGAAPAPALFAAFDITLDDGQNELIIQSAEVVLREIEFERAEELAGCGDDDDEVEGGDDDSCEEFETAPMLVSLPLDGSVDQTISVDVPIGSYDEIEFEVHRVGDDPLDLAFLDDHPDFDGISVRVTGTWNGDPFEYTSDLEAEQEIEFDTPLEADGGSIGVTLSVDVATWFVDGSGNLINPSDALGGGLLGELVEDNIENSFEGFEDDDHDGVPHDEDDDEADS